MKSKIALVIGLLALPNLNVTAEEGGSPAWSGHVSYLIGYKRMESAWSPARDQFMFAGLDVDAQPPRWPVSLTLQALMSYSDNVPSQPGFSGDFSGTFELNLGLRKVWQQHRQFQPFVGGGLSIISASTTEDIGGWWYYQEDEDTGVGWWAGAGVYWFFGKRFHAGVMVQYSWAEIELSGRELNAGGLTSAFVLGVHW